jgi:hypothetical protein
MLLASKRTALSAVATGLLVLAATTATSASIAVAATTPTPPGHLEATSVTANAVSLRWAVSTYKGEAFSYIVQITRNGVTKTHNNGTDESYNDEEVEPENTYTFSVYVETKKGLKSTPTNSVTVTTPAPPAPPPTPPGHLEATSVTAHGVSLYWVDSTYKAEAFSYIVQITHNGVTKTHNNGTDEIYNDFEVEPENTYTFSVIVETANGRKSTPTNSVTVTTPAPPPPPPAPTLTVSAVHPSSVALRLKVASAFEEETDGVVVYQNGVVVPYERLTFSNAGNDELSEVVEGLKEETTYKFAVKVVNEEGVISALSNEVSATTTVVTEPGGAKQTKGPTAPTNLAGEWLGGEEYLLRWSPSTDPVTPQADIRYLIYVNGKHEYTVSDTIGSTETEAFPLKGGTNTFYVVAEDEAGLLSEPSNVVTCTETDTGPISCSPEIRE